LPFRVRRTLQGKLRRGKPLYRSLQRLDLSSILAVMEPLSPTTYQKALQINLDATKYGAFAEIGAGQEVARWFFHVGRAANTVAKTISAYDMSVSDAIYGRCDRYVSRQRLEAMLDHEFALLLERLQATRGDHASFFVFADTVATRNPARQEDGHGWLGLRFQTQPGATPSEIIIHVSMRDRDNVRAQETLGIIGVNLTHAGLFHHHEPATLLAALTDGLTRDRVEIDMLKLSGPAFEGVDNRLMGLQLVERGCTDAAMFHADGTVIQPSEVLYKRSILVERGTFRPITNLTLDLLTRAHEQFLEEPQVAGEAPIVLLEMTLQGLASERGIDQRDFLARVDILRDLGQTVLISNYRRYFRLVEYLARYTQRPIGIALGIPSLREVAADEHYGDLPGGRLESTGRLFRNGVKLYVYPYRDPVSGKLVTAETLGLGSFQHVIRYLLENGSVQPIRNYNPDYLPILTRDVLAMIQAGDSRWEALVPPPIVRTIKREALFGWQPAPAL